MEQQTFDLLLLTMSALAVVVFAALYYVRGRLWYVPNFQMGNFVKQ